MVTGWTTRMPAIFLVLFFQNKTVVAFEEVVVAGLLYWGCFVL